MRHLVIFPGNSLKNKAWGEAVAQHYSRQFDSVYIQMYDHWDNGGEQMDFNREIEKIKAHIATLDVGTEVTIFAKSVGSLLTFQAVAAGAITPVQVVFFGIPFDMAADNIFKDNWAPVENFSAKALAFHNEHDPTTSYDFTMNILREKCAGTITLVTTIGDNHGYFEFEQYEEELQRFLS